MNRNPEVSAEVPHLDRAFSLLELLVVIAVISILASLAAAGASKVKTSSRQNKCLNNLRQQYLSQVLYAEDFRDRFARHIDFEPSYHRSAISEAGNIFDVMARIYISNPWITICPSVAKDWGFVYPQIRDPFLTDGPEYGGWGTRARNISTSYMWTANYQDVKFLAPAGPDADPQLTEPAWPSSLSGCSSTTAFITHRIAAGQNGALAMSHGFPRNPVKNVSAAAGRNPVCFGDGSVVVYRGPKIRQRALNLRNENVYLY